MRFMAQVVNWPRKLHYGISTFCLHPNTMETTDFDLLEEFLVKNRLYGVKWTDEFRFYPTFLVTLLLNRLYLYVRSIV